MNKIAAYLNEHLLGEVSSSKAMRRRFSRDGSVLSITPELVVFPRVTNDIRKSARFAWQLAEKGHPIGLTVRGSGRDTTGAAIGKGMAISTTTYLNNLIHLSPKDRLAHVQPGITFETLNAALKWNGLTLPNAPVDPSRTVGGAIASGAMGARGPFSGAIEKLEVVLANGDLLETGRISHRELSKKLGLQTFEGEVYRKLEGLVEDNEEIIKRLGEDSSPDATGYKGIAEVKGKDGSFDLTPLFVGSQGTLGIISEAVLKADFYSQDETLAVITASDELARDLTDRLMELEPAALSLYEGELFRRAAALGTRFSLLGDIAQLGSVIFIRFNDFSERAQAHKLKKLKKLLSKLEVGMVDSTDHQAEEFNLITSVGETLRLAVGDHDIPLPLIDGAFIPSARREEFSAGLAELTSKHHLPLPLAVNVMTGIVDVYPVLKLESVGDKQKLFRLLTDYAALVDKVGGAFASDGGEGRLKANAAWSVLTDEEASLYEQIRTIFDPFGTLNPGVKQKNELRSLVAALRSSYDITDFIS